MGRAVAPSPFCPCGRRKSKKQQNDRLCWTCARAKTAAAKAKAHGSRIENVYGITRVLYEALLEFQGGRCFICHRRSLKRRLSVDHDHACPTKAHNPRQGCPECVRGLLCRPCNQYLGYIKDDPSAGLRIASYLQRPPFRQMRKKLQKDA